MSITITTVQSDNFYLPTRVRCMLIYVEQGFANTLENMFGNPKIDW